jgi:hypothetical protein
MSGSDRRRVELAVWRWAVRATAVLGLGCAVAVWGWQGPLVAVLVVATVTGVLPWCLETAPSSWRAGVRVGVRCGVGVTAVAGLVAGCGVAGALLPVILVASWPRWRRVDRGPGATLPAVPVPVPVAAWPEPETLDDEALCRAWRVSLWHLQEAATTEVLDAVVRQRQRYLDELVSRHPSEVDRWLRSGPRPGGNPMPFLRGTPPTT